MKHDVIDVLEFLTAQHAEIDSLIERLSDAPSNRTPIFVELGDRLAAHAAAEEHVFYPAVLSDETAELLRESVEEHLSIKRLLADMLALDPDAPEDRLTFDAKLEVLREQLEHHAHEEEEKELFPMVRAATTADERAAIGNEVVAMFEQMMEYEPRRGVPAETANAAALPPMHQ